MTENRKFKYLSIVISLAYAFFNAIWSSSFNFKYELETREAKDIIANWEIKPIIDITVQKSCPVEFEPAIQDTYWPGIKSGCRCPDHIREGVCNTEDIKGSCENIKSADHKNLYFWGVKNGENVQICIKRSQEKWSETAQSKSNSCPPNHIKCGTTADNAFCTKEKKCPITEIQIITSSSSGEAECSSEADCIILEHSKSTSKIIKFQRADTFDALPIAEFMIYGYGKCELRNKFLLLKEKPICLTTTKVQWHVIDSLTEVHLFQYNNLSNYISSLDSHTSNKNGYYLSGNNGSHFLWKLSVRSHIPWKENERDEMAKFIKQIEFIPKIKTPQLVAVLISFVVGCSIEVIFAVLKGWDLYKRNKNFIEDSEKKHGKKFAYIKVFLIVPQIWLIIVMLIGRGPILLWEMITTFFIQLPIEDYSDHYTNMVYHHFSSTYVLIFQYTVKSLVLTVATIIFQHRFYRKKPEKKSKKRRNKSAAI